MPPTKLASLKLPPSLLVKLRALRRPHQAIAGVIEELLTIAEKVEHPQKPPELQHDN